MVFVMVEVLVMVGVKRKVCVEVGEMVGVRVTVTEGVTVDV
jgi:hypothetical protein